MSGDGNTQAGPTNVPWLTVLNQMLTGQQPTQQQSSGMLGAIAGGQAPNSPSGLSYEQWKNAYAPMDSGKDYDLVGAWQAGLIPSENQHFPDTFKFPNHPRFSIESKYWYPGLPAGRWEGEKYIPMTGKEADAWVKKNGQNMAPSR